MPSYSLSVSGKSARKYCEYALWNRGLKLAMEMQSACRRIVPLGDQENCTETILEHPVSSMVTPTRWLAAFMVSLWWVMIMN